MRYHLTPVRIAIIKNPQTTNAGEVLERTETFYTVGGNINWHNHYGEQYGSSLKKKKQKKTKKTKNRATYDPAILLLGICTMEYHSPIKKNERMPFATTWRDLESAILRDARQKEKGKCHMTSFTCENRKEMTT